MMKYLLLFVASTSLYVMSTEGFAQEKKLSISGKPQDEAACALLGNLAYTDNRCVREDPKNFATVRTVYEISYSFGMPRESDPSGCKKVELVRPLLNFLASRGITYKEDFFRHASNSTCSFNFVVERKEDLCSMDGKALFSGTGMSVNVVEINKRNDWHRRRSHTANICG